MPRPELDCLVINTESSYARTNHSWILSRMLRDYEFWSKSACDPDRELSRLRENNDNLREELK
jgi:hypothetical protein